MKTKKFKKIVALLMIAVFASTLMFEGAGKITVDAKTKTVKTSTQRAKYKNAPAVKTGTTKVKFKKNSSFVKFTAKKTKTYKITFSKAYDTKDSSSSVNGGFHISKEKGNQSYLENQTLKTYGGKTAHFQIANKRFLKYWKNSGKKSAYYKTSRTVTIKLNAGETIYIDAFFAGTKSGKPGYTIKIK
ncbi:MAG: hypothetical protein J6M65_10440 [Eubacterium sp.]|nr:hypothetical protein [Eubacterium sp.]